MFRTNNSGAFITLLGGATARPLAGRAQQPERMRRIAIFINLASDDAEGQSRNAAFVQRRDQDRLKRSLMNSGSHPEAVSDPGAVARYSTTTRRSTSPFR